MLDGLYCVERHSIMSRDIEFACEDSCSPVNGSLLLVIRHPSISRHGGPKRRPLRLSKERDILQGGFRRHLLPKNEGGAAEWEPSVFLHAAQDGLNVV